MTFPPPMHLLGTTNADEVRAAQASADARICPSFRRSQDIELALMGRHVASVSVRRDTRPVVKPLAALAGGPGAVVEDAPTAAAAGGEAAVVVQADVEDQQVAIEGLGLVGVGADGLGPGAEGGCIDCDGRRIR